LFDNVVKLLPLRLLQGQSTAAVAQLENNNMITIWK